MMDDCIRREEAVEALRAAYFDDGLQSAKDDPCIVDAMTDWAIRQIKELPAADVQPVVRGKWQLLEGGAGRCPNCKSVLKDVWDYDRSDPFCRECGADMREGSAVQEQFNHEGTTRNGKGKTTMTMTNADWIRSMSDDELGEFMMYDHPCDEKAGVRCTGRCDECIRNWLQEEHKEAET